MSEADTSALLLRVTLVDAVELRLDHDPGRARRALARGGAWALSYTDRSLAASLREYVLALAKAFEHTRPGSRDEALATLERLVAVHLPGAAMQPAAPALDALPRWSGAIRSHAAVPGSWWPFDAELDGLLRGARRLIKRDGLAAHELAATLSWFGDHGLATRVARESDGRAVVFAARELELLDAALAAEAALAAHDAGSDAAAVWLGDALGYPPCCVARFVQLSARDDAAIAQSLLPTLPAPRSSPLTMWLHPPLSLHSHAACSLDCEPTRALGRATLDSLEHARPGFAAWWLDAAARVHGVDAMGRCFALAGEGELESGVVIAGALESEPGGVVLQPRPELIGGVLRLRAGRGLMRVGERERELVLVADHRGGGGLASATARTAAGVTR